MLGGEIQVAGYHRRAIHNASHFRSSHGQVPDDDLRQFNFLSDRLTTDNLTNVTRPVAQNSLPDDFDDTSLRGQSDDDRSTRLAFGQS